MMGAKIVNGAYNVTVHIGPDAMIYMDEITVDDESVDTVIERFRNQFGCEPQGFIITEPRLNPQARMFSDTFVRNLDYDVRRQTIIAYRNRVEVEPFMTIQAFHQGRSGMTKTSFGSFSNG